MKSFNKTIAKIAKNIIFYFPSFLGGKILEFLFELNYSIKKE